MRRKEDETKNKIIELVTKMLNGSITLDEYAQSAGVCKRTVQNFLHCIKETGFALSCQKGNYTIDRIEEKLELKDYEASVLAYFLMLSCFLLPQYKTEVLCRVLEKILFISNRTELINTFKQFDYFKMATFNVEYGDKLRALEKYIVSKTCLKVVVKSGEQYYLKPLEFNWIDSCVLVKFIDEKTRKIKEISLQDIVKLIPKGVRDYTPCAIETFFELSGRLAKAYLLKEDERIIDSEDDKIIVANGSSDKEDLFARLLKYGELCQIILPETDRNEFKEIINLSLDRLKK